MMIDVIKAIVNDIEEKSNNSISNININKILDKFICIEDSSDIIVEENSDNT